MNFLITLCMLIYWNFQYILVKFIAQCVDSVIDIVYCKLVLCFLSTDVYQGKLSEFGTKSKWWEYFFGLPLVLVFFKFIILLIHPYQSKVGRGYS